MAEKALPHIETALGMIADVVLAYHPKPKSKAAKKRKRKEARKCSRESGSRIAG